MGLYWKEGGQMPYSDDKDRSQRWREWIQSVYEWVSTLIISMLVMVVLFTFFFRVIRVEGDSMVSTLKNGDQLVLSTTVSQYQRGDIVVVDRYTIEPLIKRVIAVGGDTINIDTEGNVYLNGVVLNEPYAASYTPQKGCTDSVVVPFGYVFLMGDNRMVSLDSRSEEIGLVLEKDIVGKVIFRLSPLPSFGGVYGNMEQSAMN